MKDFIARSRSLDFVATIAQSFLIGPVQTVALMSDRAYIQAADSGDVQESMRIMMEAAERIQSSDWFMIFMLFSDIAMIAIVFLFCRFIQKRKLRTLGFIKKDIIKEYAFGMLMGFVLFSACVLLSFLFGGLKITGVAQNFSIGIFILYLLGYMVQGMAEEVLCRGYFLGSYARRYPVYAAVLANSLLFACLHLLNSGITVLLRCRNKDGEEKASL